MTQVSGTDLRHRLMAILAADAAGYSRLMAADERATVAALERARRVFRSLIESNQGRVIDMAGDSVLSVFETATGAVSAALAIQAELGALVASEPDDRRMQFRIGVHLGDVIEKADGTVYGDGVNIAARLQALAEPGGITVSESIRAAVRGKVEATFDDRGDQTVKNIAEPIRVWLVRAQSGTQQPVPVAISSASTLAAVTGIDLTGPVAGFGGRPAIAVLPFANMSGDPEQEYFADGLAEDILTRLAMWRWVPVIARNSSFTYRGRAVDIKQVGRELGARYVLEGSVRKAGSRLRVTGQLIDADTGHHLWAERYDRTLADLFAIQDELTDGIVGALEAVVGRAESERARSKPPENLDAWDTFMRGWWHAQRLTREGFAAAVPLYLRAIELDPSSALPHSGIASLRLFEVVFLWSKDRRLAIAEAMMHARAALDADAMSSPAHLALGSALGMAGRYDDALAMCRRSLELDPSNGNAYYGLAVVHYLRGESEQCIKTLESAIRISPNDPLLPSWITLLSGGHHLGRNYQKALDLARAAQQRAPHFPLAWRALANALGQLGRLDEAREALDRFLALMPDFTTEQAARAALPFRDEPVFQHYLEGLRKAGWQG